VIVNISNENDRFGDFFRLSGLIEIDTFKMSGRVLRYINSHTG